MVLAQTMGYPSEEGLEQKVMHNCEWNEIQSTQSKETESEWTCRLVLNSTFTEDDGFTHESSVILTYKVTQDKKNGSFKVKSVQVDFAG